MPAEDEGSRNSPDAMALRSFFTRARLAFTWIGLDAADDVDAVLASMGLRPVDTPVVVTPTAVMRHPSPADLAAEFGLAYQPVPGRVFDLVIVGPDCGTGPAGLAASVLRGVGRPRHGLLRRRRGRRAGGCRLAHRELRRVSQRHLRCRTDRSYRHPGAAPRSSPRQPERGDRAPHRAGLPRGRP